MLSPNKEEMKYTIDSRKIWEELGRPQGKYSGWIIRKVINKGFIEDVDYEIVFKDSNKNKILSKQVIDNDSKNENVKFTKEEVLKMNPQKRSSYGIFTDYILTIECAIFVIEKEAKQKNKEEVINILKKLNKKKQNNVKLITVEKERKEIIFLDLLEGVLEPFNLKYIRQYSIKRYRIDLYIEDLNVAIEYDELAHSKYSYEREEGRQKEIEKELGCRFIRVCESKSDAYNVGNIVKELFYNNHKK